MGWKTWKITASFFNGLHNVEGVSHQQDGLKWKLPSFVALRRDRILTILLMVGTGMGGFLSFGSSVRAATYSAYAIENGYFLSTPLTPAGEAYDTEQADVEVDGWNHYADGGTQPAKIEVFNSTNNSFSTAGTSSTHYSVDMSNVSGMAVSGFSPVTATDERAIFVKVAPTTGLHMYVQAGEIDTLETTLAATGPTLTAPVDSTQTTWNYTLSFTLMQEYQFANASADGSINQNEVVTANLSDLTPRSIDAGMENYVYLIQRDSTGSQVGDQQLIWEGYGNEAADEFLVTTDPFLLDSALPDGNYYTLQAVWSNVSGTSVSYFAVTGVTLNVVPEPGTIGGITGCGAVGLAWRIHRRTRRDT